MCGSSSAISPPPTPPGGWCRHAAPEPRGFRRPALGWTPGQAGRSVQETRVERRLAAILVADVVGYSRLVAADEVGTLRALAARRREVIEPLVARHHGRIFKTMGDAFLIEFASAVEAVACAVAIQRGMLAGNAALPPERRIALRAGVNVGDVVVEGRDLFGDGVNVAARLEALAEPGGICISGTAHEQVRDKLPFAFADRGEQAVKNIAHPVRVHALDAAVIAALPDAPAPVLVQPSPWQRRRAPGPIVAAAVAFVLLVAGGAWLVARPGAPRPEAAPRLSMLVLPFANLSGDPAQDYLADVITEELTTALARLPGGFVIARSTAFTYKGKPVNVRDVGRQLGVRYVLEGSAEPGQKRVRVTAQLIDAGTGAHL
ncbi:MAG: adenylate/guanylate cyclase domain-containing protein, partial [Alphaproteobacteria bacterium]|nr:adenylate/guanylate cyclase domain-containing protein [Alphaproteobacteria bacterium]